MGPKNLIAISDVHGRYEELKKLNLENFLKDGNRIVFMGDYIGYGHHTIETIQYITHLRFTYPNQVITLQGNWENMLYVALSKGEHSNGVIKVLYARGFRDEFKKIMNNPVYTRTIFDFIQTLRSYYIESNYIFTHAGINVELLKQGKTLKEVFDGSSGEELRWYSNFWMQIDFDCPYTVVYGHVPVQNIYRGIHGKPMQTIGPIAKGCGIAIDFGASKKKGCLGYIRFDTDGDRSFYTVSVQNI